MHRTLVSLTVLSILAVMTMPVMAANTITEKVIPTTLNTRQNVEETALPSNEPTYSSQRTSRSRRTKDEEKFVPAQSFPIPASSIQSSEKETIADELAESMEGMAVGVQPESVQPKATAPVKEEAEADEEKKEEVSVMDLPPFAERYPPNSITSTERAEEVIAAYKKEVHAINAWHDKSIRPCYRTFLVNRCLNKLLERTREKKNAAKAVWVVARDFIRKEKSDKAIADRKLKDKERAEWVARVEAQPLREKGTGLVSSAPDADIDTRGMMTVNDGRRTDVPTATQQPVLTKQSQPAKGSATQEPAIAKNPPEATQPQPPKETQVAKQPEAPKASSTAPAPQVAQQSQPAKGSSSSQIHIVEPRELTLEQEEANELEYERREMAREERVQKSEEEEPAPPSTTEEERAASRDERRKAAEQKRQENIRKRQRKAQDYEKQKKLREEQNARKE